MKFDDPDRTMRIYETAHDFCVPPEIIIVARLDGRTFTRLTRDVRAFDHPFDVRFRDMMLTTTRHLMQCGFNVLYGYTQSDEISLLFHPNETAFGRKTRKYDSILAGEASAAFSLALGAIASFDGRISQLPNAERVVDYFRWRAEDAHRNSLNGTCYWLLRDAGQTVEEATQALHGLSVAAKNELLFQRGINFNALPAWQRRGCGVRWQPLEHEGTNPLTGETVHTTRRELVTDLDLPMGEAYGTYVRAILATTGA